MVKSLQESRNIEELSNLISPDRQKILTILSDKKWFKKTDFEVQKKLFILPPDFDGYLWDLTKRKDEHGGLMINRMYSVFAGNYMVLSVFEVISIQTAEPFTYEFAAWKFGREKGYRGLILFEEKREIKWFLVRKAEKFAIGEAVFETVGTFIRSKQMEQDIPKEIVHQIDKELGMKNVKINRFIDLGKISPDPVMVSSTPGLYAAVIDMPGDNDLATLRKKIYKTKPISFSLVIEPIEKIWEYVNLTDEAFFLGVVARLTEKGIIKPPKET